MSEEVKAALRRSRESIDTLLHCELGVRVHCSKINSMLHCFTQLQPLIQAFSPHGKKPSVRKLKTGLRSLNSAISDFDSLCRQCSDATAAFQDFIVNTPIKDIFDRFFVIRQNVIGALNLIGLSEGAVLFEASPVELCSQNHVDLKRLFDLLVRLNSGRRSESQEKFYENLAKRLESMAAHGFCNGSDSSDYVTIPTAEGLVLQHEQLEFGALLGNGRSARVVTGTVKGSDEVVAIKVLRHRALSGVELDYFRREIEILCSLTHPSLLRLRGYTAGAPFCLVTDYCAMGSLFDFLRKRPHELSATERTIIALDIAAGMAYMHEQQVLHRDLKSLNILLDEEKRAKICDFGLARVVSLEPMSGLVGTAQWMAPEIFLSQPRYGGPVDVYSFGIMLWELLTSGLPFDGVEVAQLPKRVVGGLRPEIPRDTPPELAALIASCWHEDPQKRPTFQQISQLLATRRYAFPGTDLSVLPRVNVRHTASTMDPLRLAISDDHSAQPKTLKRPRGTNGELVPRLCEALNGDSDAAFAEALASIRSSRSEESVRSVPVLLALIDDYRGSRSPELITLLSEVIARPGCFRAFLEASGVDFLCQWLEMKKGEIALAAFALLENHPDVELGTVSIIRSVLSFYDVSDEKVRAKAVSILLGFAARQRHFLCSLPTFAGHLLDFATHFLPDNLWTLLLETVQDLLSGMDTLPSIVIKKLARLPRQVPPSLIHKVFNCIEAALGFPAFRDNFPDALWEPCVSHFDLARNIFDVLVAKPPEDPTVMIQTLLLAARVDGNALLLLIRFASFPICSRMIATKLPFDIHRPDDLIFRLYVAMLAHPAIRQRIYDQPEFYQVCIKRNDGRIDSRLCHLLKADEVRPDLAKAVGFVGLICDSVARVTDPIALWEILGIVYKWTAIMPVPEFVVLVPRLAELLVSSAPSASLGAFLCLLNLSCQSPDNIDIPRLQSYAVWYLFQADNPTAQRLSLRFLETTRSVAAANIRRLADLFLKRCGVVRPSKFLKKAASLLCELAAGRSIAPAVIEGLTRIAES
jgi:serine/threonine protein kinase